MLPEISIDTADALRWLSELPPASAAGVITDPPYCSGGIHLADRQQTTTAKYCQSRKNLGRADFTGDALDQRAYRMWCVEWLTLARKATRPGGRLMVFIDWRQLATMTDAVQMAGWHWRGIAAWDKGLGSRAGHSGHLRHQCEYIVHGTNGPCDKMPGYGPFPGCWRVTVKHSEKRHQTGKPVELLREMVRTVPAGGPILDPFAGSGSLGVAARAEGRSAKLCELTEVYSEVAREWLGEVTE